MRRRRIAFVFLGFFGFLLATTYVVLMHTGASRTLVESVLGRFVRSKFGLQDATLDPTTGTLTIQGVSIGHPNSDREDILSAGQVEFDVNTNPLGSDGLGAVRRVRVENLHLNLSFTEGEQWDLVEILDLPEPTDEPGTYPAIEVVDSKITARLSADRPAVEFSGVQLEVLPVGPASARMAIRGSMVSPAGFPVSIEGSADLAVGELQALFEVTDIPLGPALARPYSLDAEQLLERAALQGQAERIRLWVQYPPATEDQSVVGARLNVDVTRLGCTPEQFPYPIRAASGRITASTRDGGWIRFDLRDDSDEPSLHFRGQLDHLLSGAVRAEMLIRGRNLILDERLRDAISARPDTLGVWNAFQPTRGTADLDLVLANREPGGALGLDMDLELRGADASFEGFEVESGEPRTRFPYRLQDIEGRLSLRRDRLLIPKLTARRVDGGTVSIAGQLTGIGGTDSLGIDLDIDGNGLAFSNEARDALAALIGGGKDIYDRYAPRGRTDVGVRISRSPALQTRVEIAIEPDGASASYRDFPYRLDELRGRVDITGEGVAIDLRGAHGDAVVNLGGRFLFVDAEHGPRSELWVDARKLALDDELRKALTVENPTLEDFWQKFAPTGEVDCQLSMWQPSLAADFEHQVRLDFLSGSVEVAKFARRLDQLSGTVFLNGNPQRMRLDLHLLRGSIDNGERKPPARVVLEGRLDEDQRGTTVDLTTIVRGLDLNRELARTLDGADILSLATWDVCQPSGAVDVVSRHRRERGGTATSDELRVQLRNVRSDASFLPYPVTDLNGEVAIAKEVGEFRELRGRIGSAPVVCRDGQLDYAAGETRIRSTIYADLVPVDANFARLMSGPLRETYLDRQVRGGLEVAGLQMAFRFPDAGDDFELRLQGPVIARDLSMILVVPVRDVNGVFHFEDSRITPSGGTVSCRAENAALRILGHRADGVQGRFSAVPDEIRLDGLSMRLHSGAIESDPPDGRAMTYRTATDELSANVRWNGLSLSEFVRATGQTSPSRGTLSGALELIRLQGTDLVDMIGKAVVEIRDGELGEVPIFTAIYAFLAPDRRPQFDGARMRLEIRDRVIAIEDLVVTSPIIEVQGRGKLGLDGYLDVVLEFPDFFASAGNWLILPQVLRAITSQVVRFHVYGYLRAPIARPRWLFQTRPSRVRIAPIPPRLVERPVKRL